MKTSELEHILNQYKLSQGISNLSIKDLERLDVIEEIARWFHDRKMGANLLIDYLYNIKHSVLERTTAEVNMMECDALTIPFDTTIISPYTYKNLDDKERLIPARMIVWDDTPKLFFERNSNSGLVTLPEKRIDTFMTTNKDHGFLISNWSELHNSGKFDIIVGAYGNISDKDMSNKIKFIRSISYSLIGLDYIFELNTKNDMYCAALISDRKEKEKIKVKTR